MQWLGFLPKSLGIRKKLFIINGVLLTAALLASSFAISEFAYIGEHIAKQDVDQSELENSIQSFIIIQISLVIVALGVNGYSFLFARSLTKPILNAANIVKKISEGDLSVEVKKHNSEDEVGELTYSLAIMTENLKQLVSEVRDTAVKVAADSRESAAATEELNSSVEEVSTTVQQIAMGSQMQASELSGAKNIVDSVHEANSTGGTTAAEKMSRIIELTNDSSQKVRNLAEKSAKITSVVETIREIAEKTNLLALNAAIEAARAGESGRGFAVVADEVRRLAEGSTKSSEEIDEIIKQIQIEILTTVKGIDASSEEIEEGREVVDLSLKALSDIGNKVEEVAAVAEQNASATDQASAAVDQQTSATQEISNSSQSTAALAEELEKKVSVFKLPDEEINPSELPIDELDQSMNDSELTDELQESNLNNGMSSLVDSNDNKRKNNEFDSVTDSLGDEQ